MSEGEEQGLPAEVTVGEGGEPPLGRVWIAPTVLAQIVERTTLGVPGVAGMCSRHPRFDRLRNATRGEVASGVHVQLTEDTVNADIAIVAQADANILDLGRQIQRDVAEAVQYMVGMTVGEINVYVDEVRGRAATPDARRAPRGDTP